MGGLNSIKRWFWWHRWSSLICSVFLLMFCITGLPLIFGDEIDHWLNGTHYAEMPKETPLANLDTLVNFSKAHYSGQLVTSVFVDDDEPQVLVNMAPTWQWDDPLAHSLQFDARSGTLLKDEPPVSKKPKTFIDTMLDLHRGLLLDLPGELFLGLMGVLFIVSIVSGMVLYGPFMKKLKFGTVRHERSRRLKWLDLHNLLGIVTAAWLLVVGITGVLNELSTPLFGLWQVTDVKTMLATYKGKPVENQQQLSSIQTAYNLAKHTLPGMTVTSVVYPGNPYGSPFHYLLWAKGDEPFSSRLFSPVLIDARTDTLAAVVKMPFYLRAVEVSRPLHFGDYGGTPLKVLWVLFDVVAIIVLVTGIYLWFARRKTAENYFLKLAASENNNITDEQ